MKKELFKVIGKIDLSLLKPKTKSNPKPKCPICGCIVFHGGLYCSTVCHYMAEDDSILEEDGYIF